MRYLTNTYTINNAATTQTTALDISSMFSVSAQAAFSDGTAAGTLKLQVSNDPPAPTGQTPAHWNDVSGASATVTTGTLTLIPKTDVCYNWMRWVFTSSLGAGTIAISVKTDGY